MDQKLAVSSENKSAEKQLFEKLKSIVHKAQEVIRDRTVKELSKKELC
ncbi:hypothetical protein IWQ47_000950 [Aquimarina sp. EL_43]|nr:MULTISPECIES: hypothetical protein [Aquimarina]MBG6129748.1 hypothetical protein [Aquimarina sp. EL_35]MBG6150813.1 hypothetical protein [Aquimarina sp. EL_32]MBG6167880.1 hypothetical protein [Aquimarina sp. EL_43]